MNEKICSTSEKHNGGIINNKTNLKAAPWEKEPDLRIIIDQLSFPSCQVCLNEKEFSWNP